MDLLERIRFWLINYGQSFSLAMFVVFFFVVLLISKY